MTDLLTENARLRTALMECESEIDAYIRQEYPLDHPVHERYRERDFAANPARIALATPAPDAVQEAARVLLDASYGDMQSAFHAIDAAMDADEGPEETFARALRAIAGDRT